MELIIMKGPGKKPYTLSLKMYHFAAAVIGMILLALAVFVFGMILSAYVGDKVPVIKELEQSRMIDRELAGKDLSAPLDAMAIRLAELQAQVARLNAIGNRLLDDNELDSEDLDVTEPPGQGGVMQSDGKPLTFEELRSELNAVAEGIDRQADILSVIDSDMRIARVKFQSMPNEAPLKNPVSVSRFGSRIDPFTGRRSRHDGVDYTARTGTPILAAAAGVVVRSGYHPGYGYMID
ncbi:MAG: M23 family metallopeptidase, partial [Limnobacter sp.]|nr:M23 family metallopeptidase [Limnobacter sp.]